MPLDTADLVRRYDRPGPRYTSYPTALEFHEGLGNAEYREHLAKAAQRAGPLSLYLHLPFCEARCLFCGCNVVVTKRRDVAERYLSFLLREIDTVARLLGRGRPVTQYHWGGGTPTYLSPEQMRRLHGAVRDRFAFDPDAEAAIEVDPRVTTTEHLDTLRELGFNRLSVGVQDFTTDVQEAIGRRQTFEQTVALVDRARALGFRSVNLDLIYGLPLQTAATFRETLDLVAGIRPERLAIYSYAHVPWLKGHQRKIPEAQLPAPSTKLELLVTAVTRLTAAGYVSIGMDHFAVPEDELARAAREGTLWRNFMGYTVRRGSDLVACGMTGIGDIDGTFFQNRRKLHEYERAVEAEGLAVERGYAPTPDDRLRRHVITALMCDFRVRREDVERRFGIRFDEAFARELEELRPLEADGLVRVDGGGITVPESGRLFVRNVCMVFDALLKRHGKERPRWSRTV
jgi:oxygen-independent coproporphyrinogen-3 oxidase